MLGGVGREVERIVDLLLDDVRARLRDRRIELEVSEEGASIHRPGGLRPRLRGSPLKRFLAHEVETRIGRALLGGKVLDGAVVTIDVQEDDARDERERVTTGT